MCETHDAIPNSIKYFPFEPVIYISLIAFSHKSIRRSCRNESRPKRLNESNV